MIQCHAMVLMTPELRTTDAFRVLLRMDGLVAPSFILAAGFSLGLILVRAAVAGKLRDRVKKTSRRVAEVFAVAAAYTFMGWHTLAFWTRMEILNCIAISLVICLALAAALASRPLALSIVAPSLGYLVFALSPFAEHVEGAFAHFVNPKIGSFPLFPWLGYALIGLTLGAETARGGVKGLLRVCVVLFAVGVGLALFRPQIVAAYPPHNAAGTSPAEAGTRVAWVMGVTLALMAVERWVAAAEKRAPLRLLGFFGTNSLSGYFFHEVFIYFPTFGFLCLVHFWKDQCGWWEYAGLTVGLIALTMGACVVWNYLWDWLTAQLTRRWATVRMRTSP